MVTTTVTSLISGNQTTRDGGGVVVNSPGALTRSADTNCFTGNNRVSVWSNDTLDAENSWWGSSSGPLTSGFASGQRDSVSTFIDYQPFATSQITCGASAGSGQIISRFVLVNADTNQDIGTLTNGYTINYATLGTRNLNIRAETTPSTVGSVRLQLDTAAPRTENGAPYTLASTSGSDYLPISPALTVGSHTLSAQPFTSSNLGGTAGTPSTISFTVTDSAVPTPTRTPSSGPTVVSLTLINADTDQDIRTLVNGDVIDLIQLGTNRLSIRANTNPYPTGSVRFGYDGNSNYRTENGHPYAIAGNTGVDYAPWTPTTGEHRLWVTPFSGSNASGTQGITLTITFSVIDAVACYDVNETPPPGEDPACLIAGGLRGDYFVDRNFESYVFGRSDREIDFNWSTSGNLSPDPTIPSDNFSVLWTGKLRADFSRNYNLCAEADDGVALWINGQQLFNRRVSQAVTRTCSSIYLNSGDHDIRLAYFDYGGGATIRLLWDRESGSLEVIWSTPSFSE